MKTKTPLLIIYLAASGFVPGVAFAEDKPVLDEAAAAVPAVAPPAEAMPAGDKPVTETPVTDKPAAEDLSTPEGKSLTEEGELIVPEEIVSKPILNRMELGIGYVSDDAYKFGRYNGLQEEGPFLIGNIDVEEFYEDGRFWNIHATNLGLDSRYLRSGRRLPG